MAKSLGEKIERLRKLSMRDGNRIGLHFITEDLFAVDEWNWRIFYHINDGQKEIACSHFLEEAVDKAIESIDEFLKKKKIKKIFESIIAPLSFPSDKLFTEALDEVVECLYDIFDLKTIKKWLSTPNPDLLNKKPSEFIKECPRGILIIANKLSPVGR